MIKYDNARLETHEGKAVKFLGLKITGELRGLLFEASVEQRFQNDSRKNVEVVYSFPLPYGAVLLGVDVRLNDRQLSGVVVEKKQAEANYEEAISDGNAAIMLEKMHDRNYALNLGNLAAKEHCSITLRYAQTLKFEQQGLRLLVPTVIAPRYGNAQRDGKLSHVQSYIHNLLATYPLDIELKLQGELARARVASPSHAISVGHDRTEAGPIIMIALAQKGFLDRDFVLVVDKLSQTSLAIAAQDYAETNKVAVLASFSPCLSLGQTAHAAVKILVDCSASMQGDSISAARRALQAIILQFSEGDRFSLSRFGSTVIHRSRGLWKLNDSTRLAAQRWVGDLQADLGGTEMDAALSSTFNLAQTVASDVLLITDGQIYAIDNVLETAIQSGQRLFVVGIGSSPAETHLRRLAEATGGACDFVAPGETVEPAILRMFARLRSPQLTDVSIAWPEGELPHWVSPIPKALFRGDTINIFALCGQLPKGGIRLLGKQSGHAESTEIAAAQFNGQPLATGTLSRMAASVRYQGTIDHTIAEHIAITYQLVTDKSNFLLVHQREAAEKALEMPALHQIAQMVPAGWGGTGSISKPSRMKATFSNSPFNMDIFGASRNSPKLSRKHVLNLKSIQINFPVRKYAASNEKGLHLDAFDLSMLDRKDRRYWSGGELTPFGFSEALRINLRKGFPKTFSDLRTTGLNPNIVEWLKRTFVDQGQQGISELEVVGVFVGLMSQSSIYGYLEGTLFGLHRDFDEDDILLILEDVFSRTSCLYHLGEKMLKELQGITAVRWPNQAYNLTVVEALAKDCVP